MRAVIWIHERTPVGDGLAQYTDHGRWEHPGEWDNEFVPVVGDILMLRGSGGFLDAQVIKRHIAPSANPQYPAPIIELIVERCRPLYADELDEELPDE